LLHVADHYSFDGIGGVYLPWYKFGRPKWFKDRYGSNAGGTPHTGTVESRSYVSSGNCAFKKTVLEELGGFPEDLGPKGNRFSYGEETLLQIRMGKQGKTIGFDHELIVDHVVMPDKMKVIWFFTSAFIHGKDYWLIFDLKPTAFKVLRTAASMIVSPIIYLPTYFFRLFQPNYYFQNFCIDLLSSPMSAAGKIVGAFNGLRQNRRNN
jgi:glucosyl-dolichyl phosphate glucuronosyltransferase